MGLSSYPTPTDAGVLCIILVNTAKSISTMKEIIWFILHIVGIHIVSREEYAIDSHPNSLGCPESPSKTQMDEFRSRIPAIRYDSLDSYKHLKYDCSVCLTDFKPDAVINFLSCGHVFHNVCLEKWLKYRNITCPNCRKHMMPIADEKEEEEEEDTCPM